MLPKLPAPTVGQARFALLVGAHTLLDVLVVDPLTQVLRQLCEHHPEMALDSDRPQDDLCGACGLPMPWAATRRLTPCRELVGLGTRVTR